jgi:hypothetical protein
MRILSCDVGRKGFSCFLDLTGHEFIPLNFPVGRTLGQFEKEVATLLDDYRPDVCITGRATRYYDTIGLHTALQAIIELSCEKREIAFMKITD